MARLTVRLPKLRAARENALLTQQELAAKAMLHRVTIASIEGGDPASPASARKLAAALGFQANELMEDPSMADCNHILRFEPLGEGATGTTCRQCGFIVTPENAQGLLEDPASQGKPMLLAEANRIKALLPSDARRISEDETLNR